RASLTWCVSCVSEKWNGGKTCRVGVSWFAGASIGVVNKKQHKKGVIKMFRCSFMNYYCVRRLLEMGYSYYDFVECYSDFDGIVHMFPIGFTWDNMVFLGYSRWHWV
ncbi:MAG: hypothetical protein U0K39_08030, partial [Latilactobacillus curvatus]|nr:hypothetical protein [Latilactobacillus curvatus]